MTLIPETFVKLALANNIPEELAVKIYLAKSGKKSADSFTRDLADTNGTDLNTAKRLVRDTWLSYKMAAEDGLPPELSEQIPVSSDWALEVAKNQLEELIGAVNYPKYQPSPNKGVGSVDLISDLHIPFQDEEAIAKLLAHPAENLWIAGDIFDSYAVSTHRKLNGHITTTEELAQGRALMERFAKTYKNVYVIEGNHDKRAQKRIQEFHPQMLEMFSTPVKLAITGLTNIKALSLTVKNTADNTQFGQNYKIDWIGLQGDVLFGHFEQFCGDDAVKKVDGWLAENSHILDLPELKAIAQAHTHRLGVSFNPKGRMLISTGCMCKTMAYQLEGHAKFSPRVLGYVSFKMVNDKIDPLSVQVNFLG